MVAGGSARAPSPLQCFRIACMDPQAAASQLNSVDIGKPTKCLHTIHNVFHMNFQKLSVQTFFQREWRAFGYKLSAVNDSDISASCRFIHVMSS